MSSTKKNNEPEFKETVGTRKEIKKAAKLAELPSSPKTSSRQQVETEMFFSEVLIISMIHKVSTNINR
ncbi:unnamed protein product [Rhizophagus irregularis]|nr:unnamed protein product [Rhizophagus irregularis]